MKSFALFASRDALNIDGLSEATLEKFIARGFIHKYVDFFHIRDHEEEMKTMEGFGQKSFDNLIESIEKSRTTTLANVIYALGISGIGLANAKLICRHFEDDEKKLPSATQEELADIQGVGPVMARAFTEYFSKDEKKTDFEELLKELHLVKEEKDENQVFEGMNFVITGSVVHFANRNEVKALIEKKGGKVTGSVTGKTNYLINNDTKSLSSKNKKALELGVPIISEDEFLELAGEINK